MWLGPRHQSTLEHWHHDTFVASWSNAAYGRQLLTFALDEVGKASRLETSGITYVRSSAATDTTGLTAPSLACPR